MLMAAAQNASQREAKNVRGAGRAYAPPFASPSALQITCQRPSFSRHPGIELHLDAHDPQPRVTGHVFAWEVERWLDLASGCFVASTDRSLCGSVPIVSSAVGGQLRLDELQVHGQQREPLPQLRRAEGPLDLNLSQSVCLLRGINPDQQHVRGRDTHVGAAGGAHGKGGALRPCAPQGTRVPRRANCIWRLDLATVQFL